MRIAISLLLLAFLASTGMEKVDACYQPLAATVRLTARTISGRLMQDGKPLPGAVLRLHRFLGAHSIEAAHADPHPLGEAISGHDGIFRFAEIPSGTYIISFGSPSGGSVEVELVHPKTERSDMVKIEGTGGCVGARVVPEEKRN
jgi:hypothetical protein